MEDLLKGEEREEVEGEEEPVERRTGSSRSSKGGR